ncbi:chemotaxis protein CheX [Thermosulfurimonas sp.]|uniref:chemotaxis protein CheX n=1 Tax=Thermosulfurimonas sp. TaxID=2080236 RepID=UPI0025CD5CCD|nr:chemotaxis protein CheX [Thermosulfurimonas sp.]
MNPLIEALKESVEEVIGVYTGTPPVLKNYSTRQNEFPLGEITAIAGLTGEKVSGAFVVSFSKEALFKILEALFGSAPTEVTDEVEDAAGEMANMICGAFRRRFEQQGISLSASTPSIVTGKDYRLHTLCKSDHLVLEFELNGHLLALQFCLDKK